MGVSEYEKKSKSAEEKGEDGFLAPGSWGADD